MLKVVVVVKLDLPEIWSAARLNFPRPLALVASPLTRSLFTPPSLTTDTSKFHCTNLKNLFSVENFQMSSADAFSWQEPRNSVVRGAFIVVEGVDRAGKTTQVERLCSKLYALGHNIKSIRFPGKS